MAGNFVEAKALFKTLAKLRPRDPYVTQQLALATQPAAVESDVGEAVVDVLECRATPEQALQKLMGREARAE